MIHPTLNLLRTFILYLNKLYKLPLGIGLKNAQKRQAQPNQRKQNKHGNKPLIPIIILIANRYRRLGFGIECGDWIQFVGEVGFL